MLHEKIRVGTEFSIRLSVVFVASEPDNTSVGVHEKVASDVASDINKIDHDKAGVSRILQELQEFFFVLVVVDDENSLGSHTVGRLDYARSLGSGVGQ